MLFPWPEPRPQNVPAIAVFLPPPAPIPAGWESYGFTRRLRLVGEFGEVYTAFVRDEGDGCFTLMGEGAIPALVPEGLDQRLDLIDAEIRRHTEENQLWIRSNPYENPEYPWIAPAYRVWDDVGRTPCLRDGGISWVANIHPHTFDVGLRWMIWRVRRSTGGRAANSDFGE